ncbi:MAG: TPM domain-containing protein [Sphingomicrobium sp.]
MMLSLSAEDHAKVSAAIAAAEATSDGEIIAITADQSDAYHDVGLHYAVLVLFLVLAFFAIWPQQLAFWWTRLMGWTAEPSMRQLLTLLLGIALLKFLVVLFILKWRPLRLLLTPGSTKTRRVRRRAVMLFKTGAERRTIGRTGILIYLSMGEHRAEIVGDEAITAVTTPETWGEAMAALLKDVKAGRPGDGIVAAVGLIGAVLATHFPKSSEDSNEIPDKLIEL